MMRYVLILIVVVGLFACSSNGGNEVIDNFDADLSNTLIEDTMSQRKAMSYSDYRPNYNYTNSHIKRSKEFYIKNQLHLLSSAREKSELLKEYRENKQKYDSLSNDSLWHYLLFQTGGCLTGGQHIYNGEFGGEGCVMSEKPEWNILFASDTMELAQFFVSKISADTAKTNIHTCPFYGATEGEIAVYALQRLYSRNWYDFDVFKEYKDKQITGSLDNHQVWLQRIIVDETQRDLLMGCWRDWMTHKVEWYVDIEDSSMYDLSVLDYWRYVRPYSIEIRKDSIFIGGDEEPILIPFDHPLGLDFKYEGTLNDTIYSMVVKRVNYTDYNYTIVGKKNGGEVFFRIGKATLEPSFHLASAGVYEKSEDEVFGMYEFHDFNEGRKITLLVPEGTDDLIDYIEQENGKETYISLKKVN